MISFKIDDQSYEIFFLGIIGKVDKIFVSRFTRISQLLEPYAAN